MIILKQIRLLEDNDRCEGQGTVCEGKCHHINHNGKDYYLCMKDIYKEIDKQQR